MSTHATKRATAAYAVTDDFADAVTASLQTGAVEQATDLGDGYVIVKMGAPRGHAVLEHARVPTIPRRQILRLIENLMEADAAAQAPAPARAAAARRPAEDNAALLSGLTAQALERRHGLHEQGLLLTSAQTCALLGITRQALSRAVNAQRMFAVDGPAGAQWYPAFYGTSTANRRAIESVSVALAGLPGDAKWQFFTTPKHSLGGKTPLAALEDGALEQVLHTAAAVRERSLGR